MDYYFVLRNLNHNIDFEYLRNVLKSLNLLKFAGAMMWVIKTVFVGHDNPNDYNFLYLGNKPNEQLGQKLLAHIIQGGNFGHHKTETVANKKTHVGRFVNQVVQDLKLAAFYPAEALWAPLSMIREFLRIRIY